MENMDKKVCGCEGGCSCGGMHGMGGCHHHGKHYLVKIILMMVIVIMIFASGFCLGKIVGSVHGSYGDRGMMNRGGYGMMKGYGFDNFDGSSDVGLKVITPAQPAPTR